MSPIQTRSIAEFCLSIRERENKSTREFADLVGIGFMTVSKAELGKITRPIEYLKTLKQFCSERELRHMLDLILES